MSYPVTSDKGKKRSEGCGHHYNMPLASNERKAKKITAGWNTLQAHKGTGSPIERIGGRK